MRVLRLQISAFGSLHDRTIAFGDGITLLLGLNETGKSTVLHCLAQVLYGKPSQRSLFPDFTPWGGGEFAAMLEIEHDGETYRLTRRFGESGPRTVTLQHLRADGSERLVTREAGEVRQWVAQALGTADDRLFYRVFCLTQADLHPLDNYGGLRQQLERVAGGAEVAVTAALQRLDARLATVRRGVGQPALAQNWGPLKRAADACREWEARLHDARRRQRQLAEVREQAEVAQTQITQASQRIDELAGLLEQENRRQEALTRLEELRAAWTVLEQQREQGERLAAETRRLQAACAALPPACAAPEALRHRLLAMEEGGRHTGTAGWVVMAAAVLLGIGLTIIVNFGVGAVAALLGLVIGFALVWHGGKRGRQRAALCAELGVASPADALRRLEDAERCRRELAAAQAAQQAVTASADDTEHRREVARNIAVLEERMAQIPGQALGAEEGHRLAGELQSLRAALPSRREEERALQRELAVLEEAERDLIDLEDGVAYWRQEEQRARDEEQALLLARELLVQAGEQAHGAISAPLAARIAPLFAAMTGGRYPHVCVTGDANAIDIHPLDAAGTPIPPDQLSRGTRDQFHLAVRLALGQVIAGPTGSALFLLDDPLLHFDDDRRREALAVLAAFPAQIILATHDETLPSDLPGTTVVRLEDSA